MRRRVLTLVVSIVVLCLHMGCGGVALRPTATAPAASASSSSPSSSQNGGGSTNGSQNATNNSGIERNSSAGYADLALSDGPAQPDDASVVLDPNTAAVPAHYPLTLPIKVVGTKTEFSSGSTRASFGPGISFASDPTGVAQAGSLQVNSPFKATALITIDETAAPGPRSVIVTTGGHQSIATFVVPPHRSGPAAHAEVRGFVVVGKTVYLDGSGSTLQAVATPVGSDPGDSPELTFRWKLLYRPAGSQASLQNADSVRSSLVPDKPGTYIVELTTSDGASRSSTWSVLSTRNSTPVARAGRDRLVAIGDVVQLNGSSSTDIDGDLLTYDWKLLSSPVESKASLSDASAVSPVFTVDSDGDYEFELTVNDGHGNTASDRVLVSTLHISPNADAGPPMKIPLNRTAELNARVSSDAVSDPITCSWRLLFKPVASAAQLSQASSSPCTAKPGITADVPGLFLAQLVVTDAKGNQATSTSLASTDEIAPTAIAGSAQTVAVGDSVQLDGGKSFDEASDPLAYTWSLIAKPQNSSAALSDAHSNAPEFVADRDGDYVAQLIVSNATFASAPSTVLLSARPPRLEAKPAAVKFTEQEPNTTSASAPIIFSNAGAGKLVISGIAIHGADAAQFAYTSAALPVTLAAGETTTVNVTFTPDSPGMRSATLSLDSNAAPASDVPLTGFTPTRPTRPTRVAGAQINPSSILFNGQVYNTNSPSTPVVISNMKNTPLSVSNVELAGGNSGDFTFNPPTTSFTIPAQGSASLGLVFKPSSSGDRSATLRVTDDTGTHDVPVSGAGLTPPIPPIPAVDFGNVNVSSTSSALNATITNPTAVPLHISALSFGGLNAAEFSTTTATPIVVAPNGGTATVAIKFAPAASGTRTATLVVTDDALGSPQSATLTGIGVAPQISLNPTSLTFPITFTTASSAPQTVTVTNNGNVDLTISGLSLAGANPGDFTVTETAPITVTKNGGAAFLTVTFKPTAKDLRTATLKITNNAGNVINDATVSLSGTGRDRGRLSLQPATIGKDLELLAIGSVDVAPTSNLSITITSTDPTKLLLSPLSTDLNGTNAGVDSFVGVLPAGKGVNGFGFPAFWIQALASTGTAQITMTAPGYTPTTATITLAPSGFVLQSPLGVGSDFTTQLNAADTNLTVSTARLDSGGNVMLTDQKLRGGISPSVAIVSGTPATGTISGSPVVFQGGDSSSASGAVKFHPVAVGTSQLSVTQPSGFTTPVSGWKLTATVQTPSISLTPSVVGYNLEVLGNGSLNIPAPAGGLQVMISSSDQTKLLLATDPLSVGAPSIMLQVPAGSTVLPTFYVQGLASSGTYSITATATGYSSGSANVLLSPSGFVLNSPGGGSFTTTTLSGATDLSVSVWQLTAGSAPVVAGQIRGGVSVPVQVVSGTTSTGTINNGSVMFNGGDDTKTGMSFQPNPNCVTPCTSVLSISPISGYATPVPGGQITATVNKPAVSLRVTQSTVGKHLQVEGSGALDVPAAADLQVTITSNNPNILLSASPTTMGSTTLMLTVPATEGVDSHGFPSYYIQALSDTGTAQLTISASGFASSSLNVTLAPSGFVIEGPNGVGNNFGVVSANGNVSLTVRPAVLNALNGMPTPVYESVRGGFSANVVVTSSAPSVASLSGTPLLFNGGDISGVVTLQPQTPGQTTITITTPAGYTTPSFGNGFTVTVN